MTDVTERNREPVTPNNDQPPRTTPTPTPHPLDDHLPPSLFAPPGKGSPPPLFGPVASSPAEPEDERADAPGGGRRPASDGELPGAPGGERRPAPGAELSDVPGVGLRPAPDGGLAPAPDGQLPRSPRAESAPAADAGPGPSPRAGTTPPVPPRTVTPEPPNVSLHLGPTPDRRTGGSTPVSPSGGSAAEDRTTDRPAGSPTPARPAPDRRPDRPTEGPTPAHPTPTSASAPARPAPLDGNLHLKPVRRLRTEPSAEWTPHPSYGAEPGAGKGAGTKASAERESRAVPAKGPVDDSGPDTELDLVLDLAPGDRAASATFSVPVSVPASGTAPVPTPASASGTGAGAGARTGAGTGAGSRTGAPATTTAATPPYPARRHSVIANETTASIPVHLLFRDDQEPAEAAALPAAVVRRPAGGDRAPATRRPPVPRSPQTRVQPSTRPAPVADPRLAERPGPALPGYAALLTGAAGIAGGLAVLWWRGALPAAWQNAVGLTPRPDLGIGAGAWALLALLTTMVLLALGGLGRGRVGYAWVLTLFGDYRGSVRRTGLVWVSPLLLRRRVDVRLRHWRSEPLPAVDANGTALRVVVLVVWRIKDTVRAVLGIEDHEAYLSAQVEAAMARVLSQLPADAFHEDAPSLRDAEAVGDALTRMLKADCEPVGVEVYSAQPTGIEYAPEVAAAMQRRRIAAIDSKHRDSVLTSVVDAVDDTVNRLTSRGIVELDDYERKALVKDLTVAFYTGRSGGGDGA
ncbi:SPFH domain-containing protein [Streptomyces sp. WY228]|uniref:SPFH domain-containing protein n=1 Tax=Streptomyces sp. WY228 TaxID=2855836 RepID=UPI001C4FEFBA|nr:SPFH domain-containing protein [Streptomyces sp. WY228]QXQ97065.1 membrane protease subunit [Streptomyces sp. WY228]